MPQLVTVTTDELPGDVPGIWTRDESGVTTLYVRKGVSDDLRQHLERMAAP